MQQLSACLATNPTRKQTLISLKNSFPWQASVVQTAKKQSKGSPQFECSSFAIKANDLLDFCTSVFHLTCCNHPPSCFASTFASSLQLSVTKNRESLEVVTLEDLQVTNSEVTNIHFPVKCVCRFGS